jgi:hypothetical protein
MFTHSFNSSFQKSVCWLAEEQDVVEIARFRALRRRAQAVMNDITLRNRGFGPEAAMQLVEERAPDGFVRSRT